MPNTEKEQTYAELKEESTRFRECLEEISNMSTSEAGLVDAQYLALIALGDKDI